MNALSETFRRVAGLTFARRLALIGAIILAEKLLLYFFFVDFDAAPAPSDLGAWVRSAQHWVFRFAVTLGAFLAVLAWTRDDAGLKQLNVAVRALPVRVSLLLLHFALILPLVPLSHLLYGNETAHLPLMIVVTFWSGCWFAAAAALGLAFAPWHVWRDASRVLGVIWAYAACAAALAATAMDWSQRLWAPTASVTFNLVHMVLAPMLPTLRSHPADLVLYTDKFAVQVTELCSGLEGVGLMLAFCGAWLVYCRREFIFPRALLLIPAGLVLIFGLNVLRIASLMMIGDAGHTDLAVYGFHSAAGWIAFNCAACGVAIVSRRSAWLQRPAVRGAAVSAENPAAAYLVPFLILLGGRMILLAVSGSPEPWYALPACAGGLALWHYRRHFSALDWRFSWRGVAAGFAVFVLWTAAARWLLPLGNIPEAMSSAAQPWTTSSVLARLIGSVAIVPIAEELAYRGYLLRRLVAADFTAVRFEAVGCWPVLVSAGVFAAAHGTMWPPGVLAGIAYGLLVTRTGRIGESVCAHAVTNGLIAVTVVTGNHWELWS